MHQKRPTEMKAKEEKPSVVVEKKIKEAAMQPFIPGIRDGWHGFKNRWQDGDIDAKSLGIKPTLSPEEAAIAIAGKAQEQREIWKEKSRLLEQANQELRRENALLRRRNRRLEEATNGERDEIDV